ncbi:MAG: nucleotidyl transferase AbiEii/AbiGii toxin family protein [Candidatus Omnitrophica bacterium]|nr:nucleotidyl transferase AbiEii/AbiGii toxin family protein [Candidatus Omnitrophota bacterium]
MKPLRNRLLEARKRLGLPWEVLERDYLLSWILAGVIQVDALKESLVFKGGTALKKCYFGDYRFSEDLDFSAVGSFPKWDAMEAAMREACVQAVRLIDPYAPVEIFCERYTERDPHPGGQEAFTVRARLPWQSASHTRIRVEITVDEKVLRPYTRRTVLHEYGEPLQAGILVYSLEEIVAEKLRSILQHAEALKERGWSRSRARDYYDLWRILGTYCDRLELSAFPSFLREKCKVRGVAFTGPDSFFPEALLSGIEDSWDSGLGSLVPRLPPFGKVIGELRPQIASLFTGE